MNQNAKSINADFRWLWVASICVLIFGWIASLYITSNQDKSIERVVHITIAAPYVLFALLIIESLKYKYLLGKRAYLIRYDYVSIYFISGAFTLVCILLSILALKCGVSIFLATVPYIAVVAFHFLSGFYKCYAFELREKGIVLQSNYHHWEDIERIYVNEERCRIELKEGRAVSYAVDLLRDGGEVVLERMGEFVDVRRG